MPVVKWYALSGFVVVLDQVTKHLAEWNLALHKSLPVFPGFNLTLMYNKGAAFSFLSNAGGWQRWFFVSLSSVVSVALIIWLWRLCKQTTASPVTLQLALALVLGGAVGNLIDRAWVGQVTDFIQVFYGEYYFPAFNIADSAISAGAGLMMIDMLRGEPSHN